MHLKLSNEQIKGRKDFTIFYHSSNWNHTRFCMREMNFFNKTYTKLFTGMYLVKWNLMFNCLIFNKLMRFNTCLSTNPTAVGNWQNEVTMNGHPKPSTPPNRMIINETVPYILIWPTNNFRPFFIFIRTHATIYAESKFILSR